jgi:hypothetical protein
LKKTLSEWVNNNQNQKALATNVASHLGSVNKAAGRNISTDGFATVGPDAGKLSGGKSLSGSSEVSQRNSKIKLDVAAAG